MEKYLLEVENLRTYYRTRAQERIYAVDDVSFQLAAGKVFGVAGESGCGKSTLALSLMGFYLPPLHYDSGAIRINGNEITQMDREKLRAEILGREIAYIPQAAMNALNPTQKVIHFIEDLFQEHRPDLAREQVRQIAAERFETLNLPQRVLRSFPNELSGGMKQRTVIAISTILNPRILIADEPTSALDVSTQKVVIKLLKELLERRYIQAMIFITHELPLLYHIADEIMVMYAGEAVEKAAAAAILLEPVHPYSRELMHSVIVPEVGMKSQKLSAIAGAPPNLRRIPPGCRFAERCRLVRDECRESKIKEQTLDGRSFRCLLDPGILQDDQTKGVG